MMFNAAELVQIARKKQRLCPELAEHHASRLLKALQTDDEITDELDELFCEIYPAVMFEDIERYEDSVMVMRDEFMLNMYSHIVQKLLEKINAINLEGDNN